MSRCRTAWLLICPVRRFRKREVEVPREYARSPATTISPGSSSNTSSESVASRDIHQARSAAFPAMSGIPGGMYTASSVTKLNSFSTSRASFAVTKAWNSRRMASASVVELVEVVGGLCCVSCEQARQTKTRITSIRQLTFRILLLRRTGSATYRRVRVTRANGLRTPELSLSICHCQESFARS